MISLPIGQKLSDSRLKLKIDLTTINDRIKMKTLFNILIITAILAFNSFYLNAQKVKSQFLNNDSDSLFPGNFYMIELKNSGEYTGKLLKADSLYLIIKNQDDEIIKVNKNKINKCLNIFTNRRFSEYSGYLWIINMSSGYYYDSVTMKGSSVRKDTLSFWLQTGKEINVLLKNVESVEIYNNFKGELESDPMNMFFPYMFFSKSDVKTDEFDLSDFSNNWKAAYIRYLVNKYY